MVQHHKLNLLLALFGVLACVSPLAHASSPTCEACHWGVRLFDDALCDVAVAEKAEKLFCSVVQSDDCPAFAQALMPVVIDWARSNADPSMLCSAVDVCAPGELLKSPQQALQQRRFAATREHTACGTCKFVVDSLRVELEGEVLTPNNVESVKDKGHEACEQLPEDMVDACSAIVDNFADLLVKLVDHLEPDASCAAIGLCAPDLLSRMVPFAPLPAPLVQHATSLHQRLQQVKGPEVTPYSPASLKDETQMCDVCHLAVQEAHDIISNPQTQAQLLQYTKALCENLGEASDACKQYVDIYAPAVFAMAIGYLNPGPVCQAVQLCHDAAAAATPTRSTPKPFLPGATWTMSVEKLQQRGEEIAQNQQMQGLSKATTTTQDAGNQAHTEPMQQLGHATELKGEQAEAARADVARAIAEQQRQRTANTILQKLQEKLQLAVGRVTGQQEQQLQQARVNRKAMV